jgi:hypothetical protein
MKIEEPGLIGVGIFIFLVLAFSLPLGIFYGRKLERSKAIEANVGAWVIEKDTGQVEFIYRCRKDHRD